MMMKPIMNVYCIDGCHGSGKTTLLNKFSKSTGIKFMDEGFLELDNDESPQSFKNEQEWTIQWIERMHRACKEAYYANQFNVFFDRSPYAACAYVEEKANVLREDITFLLNFMNKFDEYDIRIHIWILEIDQNQLWNQIQSRLEKEPFRQKYKEHLKDHMLQVYDYFHKFSLLEPGFDVVRYNTNELQSALYDLVQEEEKEIIIQI